MTLLESIRTSAAAADAGELVVPSSKYPVSLDAAEVFRNLKTEVDDPPGGPAAEPVRKLSGWELPGSAAEAMQLVDELAKKLRRKTKSRKSTSGEEVEKLLDGFPVEKLGLIPGGEVMGLIARTCVDFGLWGRLGTLILHGLVGSSGAFDLVEKLVEKHRSDLLCLCARHVPNLRSSDLLAIMRYFLAPTEESHDGMLKVREEWKKEGLSVIEKATQKGLPQKTIACAREASVLLMMAHDGFTTSELCLHHLFSSKNLEGLVMSSAILRLDGAEVLRLVRYLGKWLEKYRRFPTAVPCPAARSILGLKACEWVPSLESVVGGLSQVLDEHYSYLVLNPEFHEEMKSIERVVKSLALEANECRILANVIEHLQSDTKRD